MLHSRLAYLLLASASVAFASVEIPPTLTGRSNGLLPEDDAYLRMKRQNAPCNPGQYYTTRCKTCTSGYYCPDGQNRVVCGAGAYSGPGATQCTLCPYGTYSGKQTTKYVTGCTTVAPGHRANAPIGATAEQACGKGSYSQGATDTCTTCPAGSKCTSSVTSEPTQCDPGTYSNAGNGASCTKCSKGTFNNINGATGCCTCCSGFYSDTTGATACTACPAGQGSPPGSKAASRCSANNTNGVATCNQASDGTCPVTANTVAASGGSRRIRRDSPCDDPKDVKCPIPGFDDMFECVDPLSNVESCGGCTASGGKDCTTIQNADGFDCVLGSCVVRSCTKGYDVSSDGKSCQQSSFRRFVDE